jgi:hypothetical protein
MNSSCSSLGSRGVRRAHNWKNHIYIEKIFSRTSKPISIKLGVNRPWMKRNKNVYKKGQALVQGEIITEMQKWGGVI